jgi:hypothetical protein
MINFMRISFLKKSSSYKIFSSDRGLSKTNSVKFDIYSLKNVIFPLDMSIKKMFTHDVEKFFGRKNFGFYRNS